MIITAPCCTFSENQLGSGRNHQILLEDTKTPASLIRIIRIEAVSYTHLETGVESVAFEVITGVPAASDPVDPSYQDMDIRTGVFTSQKAFCRVHLNGVAIEGIDMLVDVKEINDHALDVYKRQPKNIMLGAGTLYKNFEYSTESSKWTGTILGATSGGTKLAITPEITDIEDVYKRQEYVL